MARYIDAYRLKEKKYYDEKMHEYCVSIAEVDWQPTADVRDVKHGKWVKVMPRRRGRNATYKCSCCGRLRSSYYNDVQDWEYCPCGAKMDKE